MTHADSTFTARLTRGEVPQHPIGAAFDPRAAFLRPAASATATCGLPSEGAR